LVIGPPQKLQHRITGKIDRTGVTNMNAFTGKNTIRSSDLGSDLGLVVYHKLLDYHVTEIVMATLTLGAILFFRLHR
jgi:hypothetical protein